TSHGSIGNFTSRGKTRFVHIFKNLRRPDNGNMSSFADPKYLLLNFAQSFKTDFHGEVTTCNHDTERLVAHSFQQQGGKVFYSSMSFDFQNDRRNGGFTLPKLLAQQPYINRAAHE